MQENRTTGFRSVVVDAMLAGGVVALLVACAAFLIAWYPAMWGRCLEILDVRNWTHWAWTGVGVALLAVFLLMRLWPEKSARTTEER
jgi:sterol desaturase/sphingolipid hydroxylase (fatty acid hydroxylase superfamily)